MRGFYDELEDLLDGYEWRKKILNKARKRIEEHYFPLLNLRAMESRLEEENVKTNKEFTKGLQDLLRLSPEKLEKLEKVIDKPDIFVGDKWRRNEDGVVFEIENINDDGTILLSCAGHYIHTVMDEEDLLKYFVRIRG